MAGRDCGFRLNIILISQKKILLKNIALICRIILGVVFVWASFDKLFDPKGFAEIIYNYKILPTQMVNLTAVVLPWIELVCGILLIIGFYHRGSVFILNCLLIIFIVSIGSALYRGLDIQCGCFTLSPEADRIAVIDLIIDGALFMLGLWILFSKKLNTT
jgi:uncharacterized membrane protein YphA (DoxX/SURF4 family)